MCLRALLAAAVVMSLWGLSPTPPARATAPAVCEVSVTTLGSGGPMHGGGRGDAAYLIQAGDRPLLVVDMGGDTPTELAKAGVAAGRIPVLAISHVHPDHVSGVPDYIWGEIQAGRNATLTVLGPPAAPNYRSAQGLFEKLFAADGAFPALADVLTGKPFPIAFRTAPGDGGIVHQDAMFVVKALKVTHGDLPALAYRVEVGGRSIVLAGDQDMQAPGLADFARNADMMIAHAIADEASATSIELRHMVATPSAIGRVARQAGVKRLVLSHWLAAPAGAPNAQHWSLPRLATVTTQIKRDFGGPTQVARDGARYVIGTCSAK